MTTKDLENTTVGVVTALPEEFATACEVFGALDVDMPGSGAGRKYAVAKVKTTTGATHLVAIAQLNDMGTNSAAIRATLMKQHCVGVKHILMVGIAGAVPNPAKPSEHVRLGDLIISNREGVVQFDNIKLEPKKIKYRYPPRPPGAVLLDAVNALRAGEERSRYPWEKYIERAVTKHPKWAKPAAKWDTLQDDVKKGDAVEHPEDGERRNGQPRTFFGPIGSSNTLLKDPKYRDVLRDTFGVRAVEMETSGIADAAWNLEISYLAVRAGCDYCNPAKGDRWHRYSALVAAAYARCVVEAIPPSADAESEDRKSAHEHVGKLSPTETNVRRRRDVTLVKRVFAWLHPQILAWYFDRLELQRITLGGFISFQGFERVVTRSDFHLNDAKLSKLIRALYQAWVDCVRFVPDMDMSNNGQELFFRLPGDVFVSQAQEHALHSVQRAAQPMYDALQALNAYITKNYVEIDLSKAGNEALAAVKELGR